MSEYHAFMNACQSSVWGNYTRSNRLKTKKRNLLKASLLTQSTSFAGCSFVSWMQMTSGRRVVASLMSAASRPGARIPSTFHDTTSNEAPGGGGGLRLSTGRGSTPAGTSCFFCDRIAKCEHQRVSGCLQEAFVRLQTLSIINL